MALLVVTPVILLLQSPLVQYLISALLTSLTTIGVITVFFGHKVLAVYSPSHIIVTGATAEMTDSFSAYTHSVGATVRCKYCKQVDLNEIMTGGNVSFAATRPGTTPLPPSPRFSRNPLRPPSLGGVGSSSAAAAAAVDEVIVVVGAAVNRIGQPT
ncbi:hypothetical protein BC828DRAFT_390935 [Blastocladiella britannica]|nr:hypothetical protein BC828DRAFT_390935 [Blastocladiella britannica]